MYIFKILDLYIYYSIVYSNKKIFTMESSEINKELILERLIHEQAVEKSKNPSIPPNEGENREATIYEAVFCISCIIAIIIQMILRIAPSEFLFKQDEFYSKSLFFLLLAAMIVGSLFYFIRVMIINHHERYVANYKKGFSLEDKELLFKDYVEKKIQEAGKNIIAINKLQEEKQKTETALVRINIELEYYSNLLIKSE